MTNERPRIRRCDYPGCNAEIVWLAFRSAAVSVDAETVGSNDKKFDRSKHMLHLATCPGAKEFQEAASIG